MTTSTVPTLALNTGAQIPQVGFGVFQVPPEETAEAVATALEVGYRSLDTARIYGNEKEVGEAIAASGIDRDELFVTTKLWNADQGHDSTLREFERSLQLLGLERLDLYLIHWPLPSKDRYVESWKALEEVHADGRATAIGVSNFQISHLERLFAQADVVPAVNQVELHPRFQQPELRGFHAEHGILTEAWSPLAQGALLDDPDLKEIGETHSREPAQVVLRWHLQLGNVIIPKSVTPKRIASNIDITGFELDEAEMGRIAGLHSADGRIGPDPDTMTAGA